MTFSRRGATVAALATVLALVPAAVTVGHDDDEPDASSLPASQVGTAGATLQGKVKPRGRVTSYKFEYGRTTAYGQSTSVESAGTGHSWVSVAKQVTGLAANTTYHYRVVAWNAEGTSRSSDKHFKTAPAEGVNGNNGNQGNENGNNGNGNSEGNPGKGDEKRSENSQSDDRGSETAPGQVKEEKPEYGETVGVTPSDGHVRVLLPDQKTWGTLEPGGTVPNGSVIDARNGAVTLTTAVTQNATQKGTFWGGVFEVRQNRDASGYTDLYLRGENPPACGAMSQRKALARASAKRRKKSLWGRDSRGRFRTHGRNSVATVRGTSWYTEERCGGTHTHVTEGAVIVRAANGRIVTLTAGKGFLARPYVPPFVASRLRGGTLARPLVRGTLVRPG
jgi:hypothetical protein